MVRLAGWIILWLLLFPGMAVAAQNPLWEFGIRGGKKAWGVDEDYRVREIYLLRALPWSAALAKGVLTTRLDFSTGHLEADGDEGAILAMGLDLVWQSAEGEVEIEGGFRPTVLDEHVFGSDDYGGFQQFTSHLGIALKIAPFMCSYRYQHTSNAGIYDSNDGLNLHLFGIGYRF